MSSSIDTKASITQAAQANPVAVNLDCGSEAARQVAVWILATNVGGGFPTIDTVTVGGTDSLSLISGTALSAGLVRVEVWGGTVTVTGTQSVSIHKSGGGNFFGVLARKVSGTDLINNGASATTVDSPVSRSLTSPSGDATATGIIHDGTSSPTSNKTRDYTDNASNHIAADTNTGANPTHTWTGTGIDWTNAVVAGVNFRAAAVAEDLEGAMLLS